MLLNAQWNSGVRPVTIEAEIKLKGGRMNENGEVLREKRRAAGLTQKQVANALGITAPGGSPGLRADSKEIKIWHVICCRGCRAGEWDYVPIQKKSGFGT